MMSNDQQPLEESATPFSLQLSAVAESAAVQETETNTNRIENNGSTLPHDIILQEMNGIDKENSGDSNMHDGSGGPAGKRRRKDSNSPGVDRSGRVHSCNRCNQTFSRCHNLKTHQLIHTGDKPFECKQCHAFFSRAYDLRRHEKSHTGEKPYVCMYCHRGFSRLDALNRHMRVSGPDGVPKAPCAGTNNSFPARSRIMVMNNASNAMNVSGMVGDVAGDGNDGSREMHEKQASKIKKRLGNNQEHNFNDSDAHADDVNARHVEFDPSNPASFQVHPVHFANFSAFSNGVTAETVNLYYAAAAAASASSPASSQNVGNSTTVLVNANGTPLAFPYHFPMAAASNAPSTSQAMTPPASHNASLSNSPSSTEARSEMGESKAKLETDRKAQAPATPEPEHAQFGDKEHSAIVSDNSEANIQHEEGGDVASDASLGHANSAISHGGNMSLPYFPASMYFGAPGSNNSSIPSFFLPTTVSVHESAMASFDNTSNMVHGDMNAAYFSEASSFNFETTQSNPSNEEAQRSGDDVKFVGMNPEHGMSENSSLQATQAVLSSTTAATPS